MAVTESGTVPTLLFLSDYARFKGDPTLYVVGRWGNLVTATGDASGGIVTINTNVLPQEKENPYLPVLNIWWTLRQLSVYAGAGGAVQCMCTISNDWLTGSDFSFSTGLVLGTNSQYRLDGLKHDPEAPFWAKIGSYGEWTVKFSVNNNGGAYGVSSGGLLLKDKTQLIAEGLWKGD